MSVEPLRVLIVDDSRIFRGVIEDALAGRSDVRVVGSVWSGEKAIEFAQSSLPDFVTLDIEMPGIGGIGTLKALREIAKSRDRAIGVVLVSSQTRRGAAVTVEGLQEGAFDFIAKPDGADESANFRQIKDQILSKIEAYRSRRPVPTSATMPPTPVISARRRSSRFRAVVIGASTGGPEALARLIPVLAPLCPVPIFLVQHMPPDFTEFFAVNLSRRCNAKVVEAKEGMIAEPGTVLVAPGGKHMILNRCDGKIVAGFSESPAENGCRPAADVLFRSASVAYTGQVLAIVMTGMGNDGAKGAAVLKRSGAHVIVQDEASSVVWGMPGSVVAAGAADQVLPLCDIGRIALSQLGIGD